MARGSRTLFFLRGNIVVRHLQTHLLGQVLHGFNKAHASVFHQETDGIAVFSAAETVIELFGGAHTERGRLFTMKGTQPHEIGTALLQRDIAAHHVDDVNAGK